MGFLSSLDISGSALSAQRMRMDVISQNVANIDTTRDADGNPYRRRIIIFQAQDGQTFSQALNKSLTGTAGTGVKVTEIMEDPSEFKLEYDPNHPDADEFGYVRKPNVDLAHEMIDMMSATRSYEANITLLNSTKSMAMSALDIGK